MFSFAFFLAFRFAMVLNAVLSSGAAEPQMEFYVENCDDLPGETNLLKGVKIRLGGAILCPPQQSKILEVEGVVTLVSDGDVHVSGVQFRVHEGSLLMVQARGAVRFDTPPEKGPHDVIFQLGGHVYFEVGGWTESYGSARPTDDKGLISKDRVTSIAVGNLPIRFTDESIIVADPRQEHVASCLPQGPRIRTTDSIIEEQHDQIGQPSNDGSIDDSPIDPVSSSPHGQTDNPPAGVTDSIIGEQHDQIGQPSNDGSIDDSPIDPVASSPHGQTGSPPADFGRTSVHWLQRAWTRIRSHLKVGEEMTRSSILVSEDGLNCLSLTECGSLVLGTDPSPQCLESITNGFVNGCEAWAELITSNRRKALRVAEEKTTGHKGFFGWRKGAGIEPELGDGEVKLVLSERGRLKVFYDDVLVMARSGPRKWGLRNLSHLWRKRSSDYELLVVEDGLAITLDGETVWGLKLPSAPEQPTPASPK